MKNEIELIIYDMKFAFCPRSGKMTTAKRNNAMEQKVTKRPNGCTQ